jgi:hypothetical protein
MYSCVLCRKPQEVTHAERPAAAAAATHHVSSARRTGQLAIYLRAPAPSNIPPPAPPRQGMRRHSSGGLTTTRPAKRPRPGPAGPTMGRQRAYQHHGQSSTILHSSAPYHAGVPCGVPDGVPSMADASAARQHHPVARLHFEFPSNSNSNSSSCAAGAVMDPSPFAISPVASPQVACRGRGGGGDPAKRSHKSVVPDPDTVFTRDRFTRGPIAIHGPPVGASDRTPQPVDTEAALQMILLANSCAEPDKRPSVQPLARDSRGRPSYLRAPCANLLPSHACINRPTNQSELVRIAKMSHLQATR